MGTEVDFVKAKRGQAFRDKVNRAKAFVKNHRKILLALWLILCTMACGLFVSKFLYSEEVTKQNFRETAQNYLSKNYEKIDFGKITLGKGEHFSIKSPALFNTIMQYDYPEDRLNGWLVATLVTSLFAGAFLAGLSNFVLYLVGILLWGLYLLYKHIVKSIINYTSN
jgi:hypothetical protein